MKLWSRAVATAPRLSAAGWKRLTVVPLTTANQPTCRRAGRESALRAAGAGSAEQVEGDVRDDGPPVVSPGRPTWSRPAPTPSQGARRHVLFKGFGGGLRCGAGRRSRVRLLLNAQQPPSATAGPGPVPRTGPGPAPSYLPCAPPGSPAWGAVYYPFAAACGAPARPDEDRPRRHRMGTISSIAAKICDFTSMSLSPGLDDEVAVGQVSQFVKARGQDHAARRALVAGVIRCRPPPAPPAAIR